MLASNLPKTVIATLPGYLGYLSWATNHPTFKRAARDYLASKADYLVRRDPVSEPRSYSHTTNYYTYNTRRYRVNRNRYYQRRYRVYSYRYYNNRRKRRYKRFYRR